MANNRGDDGSRAALLARYTQLEYPREELRLVNDLAAFDYDEPASAATERLECPLELPEGLTKVVSNSDDEMQHTWLVNGALAADRTLAPLIEGQPRSTHESYSFARGVEAGSIRIAQMNRFAARRFYFVEVVPSADGAAPTLRPIKTLTVIPRVTREQHYFYAGQPLRVNVPIINMSTLAQKGDKLEVAAPRSVTYRWVHHVRPDPDLMAAALNLLNEGLANLVKIAQLKGSMIRALGEPDRPIQGDMESVVTVLLCGGAYDAAGRLFIDGKEYKDGAVLSPAFSLTRFASWPEVKARLKSGFAPLLSDVPAAASALVRDLFSNLLKQYTASSALRYAAENDGGTVFRVGKVSGASVGTLQCLVVSTAGAEVATLRQRLPELPERYLRTYREQSVFRIHVVSSLRDAQTAPEPGAFLETVRVDPSENLPSFLSLRPLVGRDVLSKSSRHSEVYWHVRYTPNLRAPLEGESEREYLNYALLRPLTEASVEDDIKSVGPAWKRTVSVSAPADIAVRDVLDFARSVNGGDYNQHVRFALLAYLQESRDPVGLSSLAPESPIQYKLSKSNLDRINNALTESLGGNARVKSNASFMGWSTAPEVARPLVGIFVVDVGFAPRPSPLDSASPQLTSEERAAYAFVQSNGKAFEERIKEVLLYRIDAARYAVRVILGAAARSLDRVAIYEALPRLAARFQAAPASQLVPAQAPAPARATLVWSSSRLLPAVPELGEDLTNLLSADPVAFSAAIEWVGRCLTEYGDDVEQRRIEVYTETERVMRQFMRERRNLPVIVQLYRERLEALARSERIARASDVRHALASFNGLASIINAYGLTVAQSPLATITAVLQGHKQAEGESDAAYHHRTLIGQRLYARLLELAKLLERLDYRLMRLPSAPASVIQESINDILAKRDNYVLSVQDVGLLQDFFLLIRPDLELVEQEEREQPRLRVVVSEGAASPQASAPAAPSQVPLPAAKPAPIAAPTPKAAPPPAAPVVISAPPPVVVKPPAPAAASPTPPPPAAAAAPSASPSPVKPTPPAPSSPVPKAKPAPVVLQKAAPAPAPAAPPSAPFPSTRPAPASSVYSPSPKKAAAAVPASAPSTAPVASAVPAPTLAPAPKAPSSAQTVKAADFDELKALEADYTRQVDELRAFVERVRQINEAGARALGEILSGGLYDFIRSTVAFSADFNADRLKTRVSERVTIADEGGRSLAAPRLVTGAFVRHLINKRRGATVRTLSEEIAASIDEFKASELSLALVKLGDASSRFTREELLMALKRVVFGSARTFDDILAASNEGYRRFTATIRAPSISAASMSSDTSARISSATRAIAEDIQALRDRNNAGNADLLEKYTEAFDLLEALRSRNTAAGKQVVRVMTALAEGTAERFFSGSPMQLSPPDLLTAIGAELASVALTDPKLRVADQVSAAFDEIRNATDEANRLETVVRKLREVPRASAPPPASPLSPAPAPPSPAALKTDALVNEHVDFIKRIAGVASLAGAAVDESAVVYSFSRSAAAAEEYLKDAWSSPAMVDMVTGMLRRMIAAASVPDVDKFTMGIACEAPNSPELRNLSALLVNQLKRALNAAVSAEYWRYGSSSAEVAAVLARHSQTIADETSAYLDKCAKLLSTNAVIGMLREFVSKTSPLSYASPATMYNALVNGELAAFWSATVARSRTLWNAYAASLVAITNNVQYVSYLWERASRPTADRTNRNANLDKVSGAIALEDTLMWGTAGLVSVKSAIEKSGSDTHSEAVAARVARLLEDMRESYALRLGEAAEMAIRGGYIDASAYLALVAPAAGVAAEPAAARIILAACVKNVVAAVSSVATSVMNPSMKPIATATRSPELLFQTAVSEWLAEVDWSASAAGGASLAGRTESQSPRTIALYEATKLKAGAPEASTAAHIRRLSSSFLIGLRSRLSGVATSRTLTSAIAESGSSAIAAESGAGGEAATAQRFMPAAFRFCVDHIYSNRSPTGGAQTMSVEFFSAVLEMVGLPVRNPELVQPVRAAPSAALASAEWPKELIGDCDKVSVLNEGVWRGYSMAADADAATSIRSAAPFGSLLLPSASLPAAALDVLSMRSSYTAVLQRAAVSALCERKIAAVRRNAYVMLGDAQHAVDQAKRRLLAVKANQQFKRNILEALQLVAEMVARNSTALRASVDLSTASPASCDALTAVWDAETEATRRSIKELVAAAEKKVGEYASAVATPPRSSSAQPSPPAGGSSGGSAPQPAAPAPPPPSAPKASAPAPAPAPAPKPPAPASAPSAGGSSTQRRVRR